MEGEGKKKARIEIIPLIDVIFFLLATFVLYTLALDKLESIPVVLPVPSASQEKIDTTDDVTLQVSDQNTCYWNKELINMDEVGPRVEQYKSQTAEPRILITGDERAKFGAAVRVLDIIRKAGIQEVSVETGRTRPTGR